MNLTAATIIGKSQRFYAGPSVDMTGTEILLTDKALKLVNGIANYRDVIDAQLRSWLPTDIPLEAYVPTFAELRPCVTTTGTNEVIATTQARIVSERVVKATGWPVDDDRTKRAIQWLIPAIHPPVCVKFKNSGGGCWAFPENVKITQP
jgi:hypothetical protein